MGAGEQGRGRTAPGGRPGLFAGADAADLVGEALARLIARRDPQAAALITAQAARLRDDTPATRAAEAELVADSGPHRPGYRAQFDLSWPFEDNLTFLPDGAGDHLFIYDHDLVTLYDHPPPGFPKPTGPEQVWQGNDEVVQQVRQCLGGSRRQRLRSIRLLLFEGTRRLAPALAEADAAHLVSHLVLWSQRTGPQAPVASSFPALRGLAASPQELPGLLAEGSDGLRSLVVYGREELERTLELAAGLPQLEHLGLWAEGIEADDVAAVAAAPVLQRLFSLELFASNYLERFPFDAVVDVEPFRYLHHLGLPGHLVGPQVRARFVDRPEVTFVEHDRRGRIAIDLLTLGWAENMR